MPAIGQPIPATIKSLTDEDLAQELEQYNFTPGPILSSTRGVYERKLFKLQTGQEAVTSTSYEPVNDDDDEDEQQDPSADEEVILQHQQPRQRTTRSTKPEMMTTPPRQPVMSRHAIRNPPAASRSQSAQSQREPSKGGLSFWVKMLAVLIVAVIVFLVIKNMEVDPASEGSEIPEQVEINV